jgi:hypothetical protein
MSVLRWTIVGVVAYFIIDTYYPNIIPDRHQLIELVRGITQFISLTFHDVMTTIIPIIQYEYFLLIQKPLGLSQ